MQSFTNAAYRKRFFTGTLIVFCCVFAPVFKTQAQISTTGCVAHLFGVDCGLYSNIIEYGTGTPAAGSKDFFYSAGTGLGVIDESDPATIQALLQAGGNPTYVRRMNVPVSATVDGHLMIDAVFARDHFGGTGGIDQTSFNTASKNGEDPAIWDPGPQNVLGKNDIIDVAGHMFREGDELTDHLWFTGIINRAEPGGDAYMDFEFYIKQISYDPVTGFESGGPDEGHTAYKFKATPEPDGTYNIISVGDFILNVQLTNGGTYPTVEVRIWVSRADYNADKHPVGFTWGSEFDGASTGSNFGYASIVPTSTDLQICGLVNVDGEMPAAPPWGSLNTKNNIWVTNYSAYSVTEVGVNITHLGLDHASLLGIDPCNFPIHTFMAKTRASNSFTAQLKDFCGPYGWGQAELEGIVLGSSQFDCSNSFATITLSPIRDDATYLWTTDDGEIDGSNTNDTITVVKPGTYTVHTTLTTTNCPIADASVYVGVDPAQIPITDFSYASVSACYGQSNGSITMSISNAPPAYHWSWEKSGGGSGSGTGLTISDLAPGSYSVTVTAQDGTGCSEEFTTVVNENPQITLTPITVVDALCYGTATGSITLTPAGGTPGYTFFWTGGVTTQNRSQLAAGTYDVTVTDSRGCTATASPVVSQAADITVTPVVTNVLCNGTNTGAIAITVGGGTSPYTFLWNDGSASEDRTNLGAGTYAVTVTDANGCTDVTSGLVVTQPAVLTASALASDILCNGDSSTITVTAGGGTAPYLYSLNGGTYQSGNTFKAVASGNPYVITVKDNKNCIKTTSVSITQPSPLVLSTVITPETCTGDLDGAINLTVSGGTPHSAPPLYDYAWTGPSFSASTEDISGLAAGTYNVIVTDDNGCTASTSAVVPVTNPEPNQPGTIHD